VKIAVILLSPLDSMGGLQVFTFNLLSKISHMGHDCTLYISDRDYKYIKSEIAVTPFKIKPVFFETSRLAKYVPFFLQQIIRLIQYREKYDVWQGMGVYPTSIVLSSIANRVPVVLRAFGGDIQRCKKLNYGYTICGKNEKKLKKALQPINKVVAMTNNLRDSFYDLDVPPNKIVNIPNTVNVSRYSRKVDRKLIRGKMGIEENTTLLITVGRYHIKKGHDLIPEIADSLRKRHVNYRWLLVGNGLEELKKDVEYRGLSNHLIIKNEIGIKNAFDENGEVNIPGDELIDILKSSDIFAFPTRLEGFPMVILEAMAAGIPIVTTNSPGTNEVVSHNTTALLSEIDDVDSMAENIIRLIGDNNLREKLIQNGKKELPGYDLNNIAKQYLDLYSQLVK
jgi:glycosyltransferase involved in cell wall biosynthesis